MKILLLSYWFPPVNVIGAVRPYEIAKYLHDLGHEVRVLVPGTSRDSLRADLGGLTIVRVKASPLLRFIETSSRGLLGLAKRAAMRLFYPDQYVLIKRAMVKEGLVLGAGCDMVLSSALPFSTHLCAAKISSELGIPWIADNRDLWADTPYRRKLFGSNLIDLHFERNLLRRAAINTVVGEGMASMLRERLKTVSVEVLMNGADCAAEVIRHADYSISSPVIFSYTGMLYKNRRDLTPVFRALQGLKSHSKFNFYAAERLQVMRYVERFPELDISLHGRVGKAAIKDIQKTSHFLVLALGRDDFELTVLTGKFFEYLESGRPIIAVCDPGSDLGEIVEKYGLGCATRDPDKIMYFVRSVLERGTWDGTIPIELTRGHQLSSVLPALISRVSAK